MPIQRKDPIPAGLYWLDMPGQKRWLTFIDWIEKTDGARIVVHKFKVMGTAPKYASPDDIMHRVLFELKKPAKRWPVDANLGLPDIAPTGTKDIRGAKPPEVDIADYWEKVWQRWKKRAVAAAEEAAKDVKQGVGLTVGAIAILWLMSRD